MNLMLKNQSSRFQELFGEKLGQFHSDEDAATATEYIILLILIACFVIAIVRLYGQTLTSKIHEADVEVVTKVTF